MNTTELNLDGRAKYAGAGVTMESYQRQCRTLETTCRQFEGTMFAKLWKDMIKTAQNPFGEDEKNAFAPLEDTVMEMVSERLSEDQGIGVWKVLYDQLHDRLEKPAEVMAEEKAARERRAEELGKRPLRPKAAGEELKVV